MKKQVVCILLAAGLALTLAACSLQQQGQAAQTPAPPEGKLTEPSFLNEEQLAVFQRAMDLWPRLYVSTEDGWELDYSEGATIEIDGVEWRRLAGDYASWDDFQALWRETFTEHWVRDNEELEQKFQGIYGCTYTFPGSKSGPWPAQETYYELGVDRGYMLVFYVNKHYNEKSTGQAADGYQEYLRVGLLQTEDGWRCYELEM